ncbi:hypothetical protein [Salinicola rhizosphaerae]|uniref:Uncharacterized protein n=1 Tax=Salinicola rhizosphaerae TaxID=1443141 RepID=A0ABQ3DV83_9GAMM|nr:hypothetical protein [Salinicola rhizosphaerae]GHB12990.1 hypothetical protein GCM10009038_08810 [Salinicola rhizosphaerae]
MTTTAIGVIDYNQSNNNTSLYVRKIELANDKYQAVQQFEATLVVELKSKKVLSDFLLHFSWQTGFDRPTVTVESRAGALPNPFLQKHLTDLSIAFVRENRRSLCVEKSYPLSTSTKHATKLQKLRDTLFVSKPDEAGYVLLAYEDLRGEARIAKSGNVIKHSDFLFALKERLTADHLGENGEKLDDIYFEKIASVDTRKLKAIA